MDKPASTTSPAEWLDLLIERAPKLRQAGVTSLSLGEMRVELAAHVEAPRREEAVDEDVAVDPLHDAATFGRSSGVPGFIRPRPDDDGGFE